MANSPLNVVIQHLLGDLEPKGYGLTDAELMARFVRSRDEEALAALVQRHASMVWGVCRRHLDHHDAEDAFQATFLVLVRKAAGVPEQAVANWLYGVARQTAIRQRATAAKQGRREAQLVNMPEPPAPEVRDADLQALDKELSRLPGHYRSVIILCDLEGLTRKDAAHQLGIPEGSVASRLARAREMLGKRMVRRAVATAAILAGGVPGAATAGVPSSLLASTIKAAQMLAAGQAAAGVISPSIAALTSGVMKTMLISKLKSVLTAVLLTTACVGGAGFGLWKWREAGAQQPAAERPLTKGDLPSKGLPAKADKPPEDARASKSKDAADDWSQADLAMANHLKKIDPNHRAAVYSSALLKKYLPDFRVYARFDEPRTRATTIFLVNRGGDITPLPDDTWTGQGDAIFHRAPSVAEFLSRQKIKVQNAKQAVEVVKLFEEVMEAAGYVSNLNNGTNGFKVIDTVFLKAQIDPKAHLEYNATQRKDGGWLVKVIHVVSSPDVSIPIPPEYELDLDNQEMFRDLRRRNTHPVK